MMLRYSGLYAFCLYVGLWMIICFWGILGLMVYYSWLCVYYFRFSREEIRVITSNNYNIASWNSIVNHRNLIQSQMSAGMTLCSTRNARFNLDRCTGTALHLVFRV
jgi:hypothetical protein